jgi:glycosyltransferase involved in cell wall biosynthesis
MLLALNIITCQEDAKKLDNLLGNFGDCFDEIVIVNTSDTCLRLNRIEGLPVKIVSQKWEDDFAKARNFALENTSADYVMWLDCDDIPPTKDEILEIKQLLTTQPVDYIFMPYLIGNTGTGYTYSLLRERIFKRAPSVKWLYPIHEQIDLRFTENKYLIISNSAVKHDDAGKAFKGLERNLKILFREYDSGNTCSHIRFSLAKDILMGQPENTDFARLLLEELIIKHELPDENMAYACNIVANTYAFQNLVFVPENKVNALLYANLCVSFGDRMAEPHITIGDYALADGDTSTAIKNYKHAMTKKAGYSISSISAYGEVPTRRLSKVYEALGEIELALYYNRLALRYSNEKSLTEDRKILKGRLE